MNFDLDSLGHVPPFPEPGSTKAQETVLLVEDDDDVRKAMERVLDRAGYGIVAAGSVTDARAAASARGAELAAAIVDYRLPDGTGADLVEYLVAHDPICRAVVVTGAQGTEPASASAKVGAHAYVRKPVDVPTLLDAVRQTVRSTLAWRKHLARAQGPAPARVRTTTPLVFDVGLAVARLRAIGNLSPVNTITAWRLLWGDSNREIAEVLGVSERTAKYHVAEVLARTHARSRAGLLRALMLDAGIEDPWVRRDAGGAGPDTPRRGRGGPGS